MSTHKGNKVVVSVISDLVTDQRVNRAATALHNAGFEVTLAGRQLKKSLKMDNREYQVKRFRLWFESGPLFYASFNIRLFIFLLFRKADVLVANDLDTLLPNYLISKLKRQTLIYDSHEYFTEVPELISRPAVRNIWLKIEQWIFPKLRHVYTVNESIAKIYTGKYGVHVDVIRNVPVKNTNGGISVTRKEWGIPDNKKVFLFQGAGINMHRGAEEAVEAIQLVPEAVLLFIGSGDVIGSIQSEVARRKLGEKIFFIPRQPFNRLRSFSRLADFGLSLDRDTNLNYRFSLPNKIFDYIHAGLPVLATRLPEIEIIMSKFDIGLMTDSTAPEILASKMQSMIDPASLDKWKKNLLIAAEELCWEKEQVKFLQIVKDAIA